MNLDCIKGKTTEIAGGCWVKPDRQIGYAGFRVQGKQWRAHRYVWQLVNGPIPDGMYVCHQCNNKSCMNPMHLYLATHAENIRDAARDGLMSNHGRQTGITKVNAERTECVNGHPFDSANTYVYPNGKRACRICRAAWVEKYQPKRRALQQARKAAAIAELDKEK